MRAEVKTTAIANRMRDTLDRGELAVSFNLSRWRGLDIAAIAASCGYDWLFIDMEHSSVDLDRAAAICVAALGAGITPVVRVPGHQHYHASRLLDAGAQGIVVPHVENAEDARAIVRNCLLPPNGSRSLTIPNPQLGFGAVDLVTTIAEINANILIVAMIETARAVEAADEIAAVDGIHGLMIGTSDLSADMGIPGQFGHASIGHAYDKVIAAARRHSKHVGMGGVYDHALMAKFIGRGVRFLLGGSDVAFMMGAARERRAHLAEVEKALLATDG